MAKENYGFALCVENKDCEDLEKRKIYQVIRDEAASTAEIDANKLALLLPTMRTVLVLQFCS